MDNSSPARLAVSAKGNWPATGNSKGEVALWNLRTGQLAWTRQEHRTIVNTLAFSQDEQLLCTGVSEPSLHLWDVASGRKMQTLRGHLDEIWTVEFAPDDRRLVSTSMDGTVKLWDLQAEIQPQEEWLASKDWPLCFSADGRTLVTIATNGLTVSHWNGPEKAKEVRLERIPAREETEAGTAGETVR